MRGTFSLQKSTCSRQGRRGDNVDDGLLLAVFREHGRRSIRSPFQYLSTGTVVDPGITNRFHGPT